MDDDFNTTRALQTAREVQPYSAVLDRLSKVESPRKAREPAAAPEITTHESGVHLHAGPIHSGVSGRTDHLPTNVESGSYVLPADTVSGHGEGNSVAGFKVIKRMFDGLPYGGSGSVPYGGGERPYGSEGGPYGKGKDPYGGGLPGRAAGGAVKRQIGAPVPVVLAGGEYVLTPDEVAAVADGDIKLGHEVLDDYVKHSRNDLVKTLKGLPGPKRD
jgi:hypothetical protein